MLVVMDDIVVDCGIEFGLAGEDALRIRSVVMSRKKRSTMFSQEADVGVKCM
jgi:hypothetical protein